MVLDQKILTELQNEADRLVAIIPEKDWLSVAVPAFNAFVKPKPYAHFVHFKTRDKIISTAMARLSTTPSYAYGDSFEIKTIRKRGKLLEITTQNGSFRIMSDDFLNQTQFRCKYFESTCKVLPQINNHLWFDAISKWSEMIETSDDSDMLEDLIEETIQSFSFEADERDPIFLTKGKPILIDDVVHFRLSDLLAIVRRDVDNKITRPELISVLSVIGYESIRLGDNERRIRAWREKVIVQDNQNL